MRSLFSSRIVQLAAIGLALALSACGGGGGGGSTPPVGGGPGGPPPVTPTPSPTPTPTMPPPPPTQNLLPDTSGRFGLIQIFDWDGFASHQPMSTSQIQSEAPHYDSVWGSFYPNAWDSAHQGMIVSRYMVPVEDDNSVSKHDLSWWQSNHPDWILYACDSSGNPTKDLAWSGTYFNDVPLNIDNPAVVQYQMQTMIPYMKSNGYNTLAADNTDLLNYTLGGNPNFNQSYHSGEYGCGTYDSAGNFHRVFGPGKDPTFIADVIKWVANASAALHNAGMHIIINHPLYNAPTDANEQKLMAYADGTVDERGFTDYGKYQSEAANLVSATIPWMEYAQQHHVAFLVSDYLCSGYGGTEAWNNGAPCSTNPATLPAAQVEWALSTYAIANEGNTDMYISPESGANYSYRPEYGTTYGKACGAYTNPSANVYQRKFQGALVIVNASSSAYSLQLPPGHSYNDIEGRKVSNPLSVAPADGYVLMTTNGCS